MRSVRLVAIAVVASAAVAACGDPSSTPARDAAPPSTVRASAFFPSRPKTLEELLERSELVVRAQVTAVEAGPSRGGEEGRTRTVFVAVTRTLLGTAPASVVTFSQSSVTDDGRTVVPNGMRLSEVGDDGIFFLQRLTPDGPLVGDDDHSVLRVLGERLDGPSPDEEESDLTQDLEQRSPDALEAEIVAIADRLGRRAT